LAKNFWGPMVSPPSGRSVGFLSTKTSQLASFGSTLKSKDRSMLAKKRKIVVLATFSPKHLRFPGTSNNAGKRCRVLLLKIFVGS